MRASRRHGTMGAWAMGLITCSALLWPMGAWAGQREAVILGRAFSYDYNLKSRAGGSLVLAVLFRPHDSTSEGSADAWFQSFQALSGVKIEGMPLKVVRLPFTSAAQLQSSVRGQGIDILFVCDGMDDALAAITQLSHSAKVMTVAATESQVESGLTLGVFSDDGKVEIVVNLPSAGQEGVSFSSDLLRLARIIR